MNWTDLISALALVMIFEGLLPFLSPGTSRRAMATMSQLDDRTLRQIGMILLIAGAVTLYFVRRQV